MVDWIRQALPPDDNVAPTLLQDRLYDAGTEHAMGEICLINGKEINYIQRVEWLRDVQPGCPNMRIICTPGGARVLTSGSGEFEFEIRKAFDSKCYGIARVVNDSISERNLRGPAIVILVRLDTLD